MLVSVMDSENVSDIEIRLGYRLNFVKPNGQNYAAALKKVRKLQTNYTVVIIITNVTTAVTFYDFAILSFTD